MKIMTILQSVSESWNWSWIFVFSILILDPCPRCRTSVVDFSLDDNAASLSSVNGTSQDSRSTTPIAVTGVITRSSSTTRRVVVFDIDMTLCGYVDSSSPSHQDPYAANLTECPQIWFTVEENELYYLYIFLPHLRILFDYLLEHGVRIAFFSVGGRARNIAVIPELLTYIWGSGKFEALKSKGQFQIHGQNDLRESNYCLGEKGYYVKDLRRILQHGESLSNAVLVEDDPSICAYGQHPVILVGVFNMEGLRQDYNPLNNVYYLLGLFKSYFEDAKYASLPLRVAMTQIIPKSHTNSCCYNSEIEPPPFALSFHHGHPFVQKMVDIGFASVREKVPSAILYKKFD